MQIVCCGISSSFSFIDNFDYPITVSKLSLENFESKYTNNKIIQSSLYSSTILESTCRSVLNDSRRVRLTIATWGNSKYSGAVTHGKESARLAFSPTGFPVTANPGLGKKLSLLFLKRLRGQMNEFWLCHYRLQESCLS